jgi:hypothetical protein
LDVGSAVIAQLLTCMQTSTAGEDRVTKLLPPRYSMYRPAAQCSDIPALVQPVFAHVCPLAQ